MVVVLDSTVIEHFYHCREVFRTALTLMMEFRKDRKMSVNREVPFEASQITPLGPLDTVSLGEA